MAFRKTVLFTLGALVCACQAPQKKSQSSTAMDAAIAEYAQEVPNAPNKLDTLPAAVTQALLPDLNNAEQPFFSESKYDISAHQLDAATFFSGIVQGTPYSVAIHPEVSGTISLELKQVALADIFDLVSDLYGYDIQRKQNIYRIYPAGLRTETIPVNYLLMKRDGSTQTSITSGGVSQGQGNNNNTSNSQNNFSGNSSNRNSSNNNNNMGTNNNGTNIATSTETDFWKELLSTLKTMVPEEQGKNVMVTPQAGLVTVRAMPDEIRAVKNFLNVSEEIVQRQVILEARIIEVSLSDGYQQGINWNQILSHVGSTDVQFSTTSGSIGDNISAALGNITSLSFINKDFSGVLSLLSTQGNVQVLSSPRVTAINNQKAVIKVGDDEYFVTDVSSQSTISSSTTSVVPNIELTPFFSGIALDVTPQIDKNGGVLLHVHPSVIETQEQEKIVTLNQEQFILPLAQSNIRESDTIIHAKSGEIVVIGGLMQSIISESESKTPLLGDIPFFGNLFRSKKDSEIKKELVILLKPTVVDTQTWRKQLQRSRDQMADWLHVE
ncbi:MAG: pilus (MSHA type) biogenesis protein MshL [Paraglaciecola sp.]|uniref:pilus (MSHA type) biogenesis protein MshL n=1 Tax=Paraglaciecola sp. TaxID=1920173 RepID=UPI00273D866C|nr:pilus (MSHA type) biogenesis protein MshL [Paraglaciecola sp.]MDP5031376.1 pilus (MSHA type) biogenesis protein MshL [Paraglaciecola sp.]MDP5133140.1 pilus (MSHA type) biogenesis protein MshL [Paraglaciecola sp.]